MKLLKSLLILLLLCGGMSAQAAVHRFVAILDQAQATTVINPVPGAHGTGSLFYDDVTSAISWLFSFGGLSHAPSAAHIHIGAPGVAGGVALGLGAPAPFSGDPTEGVYVGSGAPSISLAAFETFLFDEELYINIHTPDVPVGTGNPGGEIRGQLLFHSTVVPVPPALILFGSALGLLTLRRRTA